MGRVKFSDLQDAITVKIPGEDLQGLSKIFEAFGAEQVNIWFGAGVKNREDFLETTLSFDPYKIDKITSIFQQKYPSLHFSLLKSVNIVSVFPFRDSAEIAARFLTALEEKDVPVLALSTSLSSISALIPNEHCSRAKDSLETAFDG